MLRPAQGTGRKQDAKEAEAVLEDGKRWTALEDALEANFHEGVHSIPVVKAWLVDDEQKDGGAAGAAGAVTRKSEKIVAVNGARSTEEYAMLFELLLEQAGG